jgi:hypothetical protein
MSGVPPMAQLWSDRRVLITPHVSNGSDANLLRDGDAFFATRDVTEITITRPTPVRFIGIRVPREPVAMLLGGSTTRWSISFRTAPKR